MKVRQLIIILMISCGLLKISSISAQENQTLHLNLETAIEIALNENPSVKIADMEITKKKYAQKSAYGALLPQIDLIGQYQRAIQRQTVYFDGGLGMGMGDIDPSQYTPEELFIVKTVGKMFTPDPEAAAEGIQMGRLNVYTAGLNVSMPLVVPALWKNIQMSKVDLELAMEKARSSKIDLINQVKKSFYSLLLAQASYDVFKKNYSTDSLNLENIKNRFNQGVVAEYDVITADVRLKSIIPNILQSENMIKIAELQLKMLIGIDSETPIQIVGTLDNYRDKMFNMIIPADTTLILNSDLKQFDMQMNMAKKAKEIQKLQFAPSLVTTFNYMYMSQNNDFKFKDYRWDPYSTLGIALSIPLFNGGQRYHNLKQSEIQLRQLQEQRKDVERGLKLAIKNNYNLMAKSYEQVSASESSVALAKKGYEITLKRYETGMGTIVDVNAAALAVTSAELQYRNAIYEYLSAKSDLEKILGYDIAPIEDNKN